MTATTTFETLNFSGNTGFDFLPNDIRKSGFANTVLGPNAGELAGIGGSLTGMVMNNSTLAIVGEPDGSSSAAAKINFGNNPSSTTQAFNVTANQSMVIVNLGTSGGLSSSGLGAGGEYGGSGAFAYFNADTTTVAQVADGTVVSSDAGTTGGANVAADDDLLLIAVAGSAFKGQNLGIGVSALVNLVTRNTNAIIGTNLDDGSATATPSSWKVAGPVTVHATEDGDVINFALAGAVASAPAPAPMVAGQAKPPAPSFGSWGVQVSGDGSYTSATDNTKAYINDAGTFTTGALTIGATDKTVLVGFGGSYAIACLSKESANTDATDNIGIAGSYAEIDLAGATDAFIQEAQLTVLGALEVESERDNYLGTLTLSGAGTSINGSFEVAGAVALDYFSGDTEAYLSGVSGSVSGDLTVTATDNTIYVAIGGGVAVAGTGGGLGLSIGYISIDHTLDSYADDTTLTVGEDVEFTATGNTDVGSLGLALGVAKGKSGFAGAGNVSVNEIEMTLEAYISDSSDITSNGSVAVEATDNSYLVSISGGVAVGTQSTAAVGAAVSYNLINNTISAYINDSTVQAKGGARGVGHLDAEIDRRGRGRRRCR